MKDYSKLISKIRNSEEFQKLAQIGGHKQYHLEGNALVHTDLVVKAAEKRFGKGHFMVLVALLHDVGKIYTSVCNGPDDWLYPEHSKSGAKNLSKFISESHREFKAIQWYIYNHIQPLFWVGKNIDDECDKILKRAPKDYWSYCNMTWLRDLALCDLEGSHSLEPQYDLKSFLKGLDLPCVKPYKNGFIIKRPHGVYKVNGYNSFISPNKEFNSFGEAMNAIDNAWTLDESDHICPIG